MTRRRVLTDDQAAEVVAGYRAGATIDELASRFGVSSTPIRRVLEVGGVPLRRRSWRAVEVDTDGLVRRYRAGATQDELAAWSGVARPTVRRRLVAAGVDLRPRAEAIRAAKRRHWG